MICTQFTVYLENKAGALAAVTSKLAKAGINIEGISAYTSADVGLVQIVASNANLARRTLTKAGVSFTAQDVALLTIPNRAGSLSEVASALGRAGVNINYLYATGCDSSSGCDCRCNAIVSAPDLKKVVNVWRKLQKKD
jgi:hypothetical protein